MLCGFAQALDVVEGALFGEEDVDDEVDVVEEDPFAEALAFDGVGVGVEVAFETELDLVGDGLRLALVGAAGDEEEVGEAGVGDGVEFEDAGVLAFVVVAGVGGCRNHAAGGGGDGVLRCWSGGQRG